MIAHRDGPSRSRRSGTAGSDAQATARQQSCSACHARPGVPCQTIPEDGDHLARYCGAEKKGALTRRQLAAVIGRLDAIARWVIVPAVPPLTAGHLHRGCGGAVFFDATGGFCSCCWAENLTGDEYQLVMAS